VYTFTGDPTTINHAEWPDAGTRADGTSLYHFVGDTQPGDAKGVGGPWQLDTSATAVPAAAPTV
jgi:predicted lipoprotein with Yx(FWY)xxD motif